MGPDPTKIGSGVLYGSDSHEIFDKVYTSDQERRLCKPIKRSKSPDRRSFARTPLVELTAPHSPAGEEETISPRTPSLSALRALLFQQTPTMMYGSKRVGDYDAINVARLYDIL